VSPVFLIVLGGLAAAVMVAAVLLRRYELARATRLRLEAEQLAQHSSRELRDLKYAIDQASIIAITDQRGRITYVNDKFCEISQYARAELLGQDHRIVSSSYHPPEFVRDLWVTIANGRVWNGEIRNRAKDGTCYWVDTTIVPFLDERGKPYQYLAIRNDITQRKLAEAQLVEQAALARLGELAAVVAHEVRNPLAGIRGALQVLQQRSAPQASDYTVIAEMIRRLDTLADRVSDLLLYARPRTPRLGEVRLRRLLETTANMLRRDPAMAAIDVEITGDDAAARGDAELLGEVFLNLLLNAAQALGGRGTIRVALGQDEQVQVTVSDDGPGIPSGIRDTIFEPFFTTKRSGTGLGLAIVRRLVELHGGTVAVGDAGGRGTVMTVTLPVAVGVRS
jgi:PAS domain S-box-containing protein